jgi:hypothetical protein
MLLCFFIFVWLFSSWGIKYSVVKYMPTYMTNEVCVFVWLLSCAWEMRCECVLSGNATVICYTSDVVRNGVCGAGCTFLWPLTPVISIKDLPLTHSWSITPLGKGSRHTHTHTQKLTWPPLYSSHSTLQGMSSKTKPKLTPFKYFTTFTFFAPLLYMQGKTCQL